MAAYAMAQTQVFAQPPNPLGGAARAAWWSPDGYDSDQYNWDAFTLGADASLTEIRWRGAYFTVYGPPNLTDFDIAIWPSIGGGSQPAVATGVPLAHWAISGTAGETSVGTIGGNPTYDYAFKLPTPVALTAGTPYWLEIEGTCTGYPTWGWAVGTGGNGQHFGMIVGGSIAGGDLYTYMPSDLAFSLFSSGTADVAGSGGALALELSAPDPNPSRGGATLNFALPAAGRARIEILDVTGRRLASTEQEFAAGAHAWRWDGSASSGAPASAGVYFARLSSPWGVRVQRLARTR